MRVVLLAPHDRDRLCVRVNAVLDEFGDGLQRITLRQRDNPDGVPVVPNAQLTAVLTLGFHDTWTSPGPMQRILLGGSQHPKLVYGHPSWLRAVSGSKLTRRSRPTADWQLVRYPTVHPMTRSRRCLPPLALIYAYLP